jgi:hypothetical protein
MAVEREDMNDEKLIYNEKGTVNLVYNKGLSTDWKLGKPTGNAWIIGLREIKNSSLPNTMQQSAHYLFRTERQFPIYQTIRRQIAQSSNLNSHGRENPKYHEASHVLLQWSQG